MQAIQTPSEEERFQKNAVILGSLVQKCVMDLNKAGYNSINPFIVSMATTLLASFDKSYLIQGFIENSHKLCWDQIKKRDEHFFTENAADVFKALPMERVNLFKDLFLTHDASGKSIVPQVSKDQMWDIFDALIKISIKYIHRDRQPYCQEIDGKIVKLYHASFFDEIDLVYHADLWKVKLEFPLNY